MSPLIAGAYENGPFACLVMKGYDTETTKLQLVAKAYNGDAVYLGRTLIGRIYATMGLDGWVGRSFHSWDIVVEIAE
jgi:hypothetical protein